MSNRYVNTINRTFKIIADILNSKPTDWNPSGLEGGAADQFCEVFNRLYVQAQEELNCADVHVRQHTTSMGTVALSFHLANGGPMRPIVELPSPVVADWASRT